MERVFLLVLSQRNKHLKPGISPELQGFFNTEQDAGDEKNSRIVSPQTTVLLNSFFHQKTLDY